MKTVKNKLIGSGLYCLALVFLLGFSTVVLASKGGDEKEKKGYVLKFNGFEVKKAYITPFSLMQQGAVYRGMSTPSSPSGSKSSTPSILTFQKGNTIYLYPVQQQSFIHKLKVPAPVNR
ncbi:MAG: hypothetical protein MUE71_10290 [Chitinophagaceae bacterium]|nr:hypothetical protein [Chitinophagaceae bacterium]